MSKLGRVLREYFPGIKKLKGRLTPGASLSQRAAYGVVWIFALKMTTRLLGLARAMVLARLLSPQDFGLFGIAMLAISILDTFSNPGFQTALIQKKEGITYYLDTAWTAHIIRGGVLSLILFGISPYVAIFFDEPRVIWLLRGISLSVFLQGVENIGAVYFQKDLEFHKYFIYQFSGAIASLAVAVSAAFILRSVWALVFGLLAQRLVQAVASYALHPYRPRLRLRKEELSELFSFGKWTLVSRILNFGYTQGDDMFVGKVLGSTTLGLYQMAYRISRLVSTEFAAVIQQVTVPAYSKLQDNRAKLQDAYLQTQKLLCYISAPLAAGIAILAPDFVRLFLGEQWTSMVPALQILTIMGFVAGINSNLGPLLVAIGRPDLGTWMNTAKLGLLALLIYPASRWWGLVGVASAIVVVTVVMAPFSLYLAVRHAELDIWELLFEIAIPMAMAAVMAFFVVLIRRFLIIEVGFLDFGGLFVVGSVAYLLMTILVDKLLNYGIVALFRTYFNKVVKGKCR